MKAIGEAIKERRAVLNITQRELAEIAGVGINTLTKIERGEANPSLRVLQNVLDALGLQIRVCLNFPAESILGSGRGIFAPSERGVGCPTASEEGVKSTESETKRPTDGEFKQALRIGIRQ